MWEIGSIPKRESWFLSALDIVGMCLGKPFPAALNDSVNSCFLLNFFRFHFFPSVSEFFCSNGKKHDWLLFSVVVKTKLRSCHTLFSCQFSNKFSVSKVYMWAKKNRNLEQCLTQRTRREENFILHLPILCKVSVTFELLGTEITTAPSTLQEKKNYNSNQFWSN